jgi:hypothetical protein
LLIVAAGSFEFVFDPETGDLHHWVNLSQNYCLLPVEAPPNKHYPHKFPRKA